MSITRISMDRKHRERRPRVHAKTGGPLRHSGSQRIITQQLARDPPCAEGDSGEHKVGDAACHQVRHRLG